jgi:tRNA pseudouridine38-40 synthase
MSHTYKMTIAYDGTEYGGWQIQNNSTTIQALIQDALHTVLRGPLSVIASGRTDAGVHALKQVAHFKCSKLLDTSKTLTSINALLPKDIRILSLESAPPSFHARFSARSKIYHYYLYLDPVLDPFLRRYTYRPGHTVDLSLLKEALHYFIGTHDFTSFANVKVIGSNNERTIHRLELLDEGPWGQNSNKVVCLSFEGNGFLYKMVRNIVGTLLDVCAGKLYVNDIPKLFAACDRRAAGRAAPPQALFLIEVNY